MYTLPVLVEETKRFNWLKMHPHKEFEILFVRICALFFMIGAGYSSFCYGCVNEFLTVWMILTLIKIYALFSQQLLILKSKIVHYLFEQETEILCKLKYNYRILRNISAELHVMNSKKEKIGILIRNLLRSKNKGKKRGRKHGKVYSKLNKKDNLNTRYENTQGGGPIRNANLSGIKLVQRYNPVTTAFTAEKIVIPNNNSKAISAQDKSVQVTEANLEMKNISENEQKPRGIGMEPIKKRLSPIKEVEDECAEIYKHPNYENKYKVENENEYISMKTTKNKDHQEEKVPLQGSTLRYRSNGVFITDRKSKVTFAKNDKVENASTNGSYTGARPKTLVISKDTLDNQKMKNMQAQRLIHWKTEDLKINENYKYKKNCLNCYSLMLSNSSIIATICYQCRPLAAKDKFLFKYIRKFNCLEYFCACDNCIVNNISGCIKAYCSMCTIPQFVRKH